MSRINEAFRRLSEESSHLGAPATETLLEPTSLKLDQYPREIRSVHHLNERISAPAVETVAVVPSSSANGDETNHVERTGATPADIPHTSRLAEGASDGKFVVSTIATPIMVEQYRRLAAALHDAQTERGLKTIMVTSALPREGKTLTAVNVALTLSHSYGRRVLLVDADLRRPTAHEVLGIPNRSGLSDALAAADGVPPFIRVSPGLWALAAGRPGPTPLAGLTSERMRQLLDEFELQFDWVILDTPPVGLLPDGHLLARLTRAVILVIAAASTDYAAVDRAVAELGRDCILGTVLNRVDEDMVPAKSYYYSYQPAGRLTE